MSIRKKLTVFMLVIGLLPTIVVGITAYISISNELSRKTVDQLLSTASKQEQKINALLQAKQEEVIKLTNRFDLQSAIGRHLATNGKQGGADMYTILTGRKIELPDVKALRIVNLNGVVITTTTAGEQGKKIPAAEYAIAPGDETTITVREDERDGINKLYITARLNVNKMEAAFISAIFRIDDMVATVQDYTGLGSTGETIIAAPDADKSMVSLFPLRFDTDAALKTKLDSLELLNKPNVQYKDVTDYRGQQTTITARSLSFADWIIATKIDKDEAFASINQLRSSLLIIVFASSVIIMLAAFYLTKFFTEPILRIASISKRIGMGDFSAQLPVRRNDEIGALAGSINAMGLSLNEFVASIEAERHRLEVILNSTAESIVAIDKAGIIILANNATADLLGSGKKKIVGKHITEIFTWMRHGQPFTVDYDRSQTSTYNEIHITDMAGKTHYVKLVVANVAGAETAQDAQTIITIHDETKSRELEDMKVDFVSMAAHELRTPLAAIRGYLELLGFKKDVCASEESQKYLTMALKGTTELTGLINNLLDVTRIEKGTLALNPEKTDLAASTVQSVREAGFSASEKHIALNYAGPEENCFVMADYIALREVINNLLANAIKYTEKNGKITVTLKEEADNFVVSVHDTGIGIPAQALPNLFTKFYRAHTGLDSGNTGTGLGLFIAKSIIERHNGTIQVTSQEGTGSTFSFTIPRFTETTSMKLSDPHYITRRKRGWTTKNIAR